MRMRETENNTYSGWNLTDASSTGHQTYRGRSGAWYVNQEIMRIVGPLLRSLPKVKDTCIAEQVWDVISVLVEMLAQLKASGFDIRNLPVMVGATMEDGSFLLEWLSKNYRVGFSFEKDVKESMWYSVSKIGMSDTNESGSLSDAGKEGLLRQLFSLVAFNY